MANWQSTYEHALTRPFPLGAAFELIIMRVWRYGILAHIAPEDPAIFKRREEKKRPVWRRDDPALYWRILYAAHSAIYAHKRHISLSDAIVTLPVGLACIKYPEQMTPPRREEERSAFCLGVAAIVSMAEEELKKLGHTPHRIPFRAHGTYQGIQVQVELCDPYGRVVLALASGAYGGDEHYKAWKRLCEVTDATCVEPSALNPKDFVTMYGRPISP